MVEGRDIGMNTRHLAVLLSGPKARRRHLLLAGQFDRNYFCPRCALHFGMGIALLTCNLHVAWLVFGLRLPPLLLQENIYVRPLRGTEHWSAFASVVKTHPGAALCISQASSLYQPS